MGGGRIRKALALASVGLACLLVSPSLSFAAEKELTAFDKGVAAYDSGDYASAYAYWLPLAQKMDLAAQRNVAHLLARGLGVEQNDQMAFKFYKRAADAGLVSAQINVADFYTLGRGVAASDQNALHYYARAAKAGHPNGQYHMALHLLEGRGTEADPALAQNLLGSAAKFGHSGAIEKLRELEARDAPLTDGESLKSDDSVTLSVPSSKSAPSLGRPLSPYESSRLSQADIAAFDAARESFARGERGEALEAWRHLAQRDVTPAVLRVGEAYLYGIGAQQNLKAAFAFAQSADLAGHPDGRDLMNKTLKEMHRQATDQMDSD